MYEDYLKHVNLNITEPIMEFVNEEVFGDSEYLFIKKKDGINKAYCSKCKNEFDIEDIKHNEDGRCPSCGASVRAKLLRYGRKKCTNDSCFYYFEKSAIDPNVVICKGYYTVKNYNTDYKNPKLTCNLYAIYIFENKKTTMFKKNYWNNGWDMTSSIFDFNQGWMASKMCYCSFESIGKAIKSTSFQHMPYKQFQGNYSIVKLFAEYSKHPGIEYLVKEGFENLVAGKLNGYCTERAINWNGKTIFKILKISKLDLREIKLKKINVTFQFLKVLQDARKQKWEVSTEEIIKIATTYSAHYEDLKMITEYSSIRKILKYISKQFMKFNGTEKNKHYCREDSVLLKLNDYIADCKLLGMDINREQVLFPKDLYTMHQNTIKQIKINKNEKFDAGIKNRVKSLEKYIFKYSDLIIRPAMSSVEMVEESEALSHCLASHYTEPYAKGETNIFFIRKAAELDKPYYTIEIKKDRIVQVHGKNNRSPSDDVKEFIKVFTSEKLEKQTKRNRVRLSA
jgi:DNA-directed RNA polymerase subunit RPC12/RpoP